MGYLLSSSFSRVATLTHSRSALVAHHSLCTLNMFNRLSELTHPKALSVSY